MPELTREQIEAQGYEIVREWDITGTAGTQRLASVRPPGAHVGQERIITIKSPRQEEVGEVVGGFFGPREKPSARLRVEAGRARAGMEERGERVSGWQYGGEEWREGFAAQPPYEDYEEKTEVRYAPGYPTKWGKAKALYRTTFGKPSPMYAEHLTKKEKASLESTKPSLFKGAEWEATAALTTERRRQQFRIGEEKAARMEAAGFTVIRKPVKEEIFRIPSVDVWAGKKVSKFLPELKEKERPKELVKGFIKIKEPGKVQKYISGVSKDIYEDVRQKPVKYAAIYTASAYATRILGGLGRVGGKVSKKIGLTRVIEKVKLKFPVAAPTVITTAKVGVVGAIVAPYAISRYGEYKLATTPEAKRKVVAKTGGEIGTLMAGGYTGMKSTGYLRGLVKSIGKEYVPETKLMREGILTGKEKFPTAPTEKHRVLFTKPKAVLPKERFYGKRITPYWHAAPEKFPRQAVIELGKARPGEAVGLFVAPEPSPAFFRMAKYEPLGLDIFPKVTKPTLYRGYAGPLKDIPLKYRMTGQRAGFMIEKARPTIPYLPLQKKEVEAVLGPFKTMLVSEASPFFTKYQGVRVPIYYQKTEIIPAGLKGLKGYLPKGNGYSMAYYSPTAPTTPILSVLTKRTSPVAARRPGPSRPYKVSRPSLISSISSMISTPSRPSVVSRISTPSMLSYPRVVSRVSAPSAPSRPSVPSKPSKPSKPSRPSIPYRPSKVSRPYRPSTRYPPTTTFIPPIKVSIGLGKPKITLLPSAKRKFMYKPSLVGVARFEAKGVSIPKAMKGMLTGLETRPVVKKKKRKKKKRKKKT